MTIEAKPDGDDLRQFVCSGVSFDIDEKPKQEKKRGNIDSKKPGVGLGSLRARADRKTVKRRVRKKDPAKMQSLYSFEIEEKYNLEHNDLSCPHCLESIDVARLLELLEPHISQIVAHRVAEKEITLRKNLVEEFQRRRMAA